MTDFSEMEREEIAVQFVRVADGLAEIRRAWNELEAVVALRGRHFYGAYDPIADDYRACVEVREGDDLVPGLASGTLPGGRYLRARLRGDPPGIYELIGPLFEEMTRETKADESRPSLEHYRRHDEIDLLLPIQGGPKLPSRRLGVGGIPDRPNDGDTGRARTNELTDLR